LDTFLPAVPLILSLPEVPTLFICLTCRFRRCVTQVKLDHLFLEALSLFHSPYELGDHILCSSLFRKNNLWVTPVILLGSLGNCWILEHRHFVLLISLLGDLAIRLGSLGWGFFGSLLN
jgi:hypothetical protein